MDVRPYQQYCAISRVSPYLRAGTDREFRIGDDFGTGKKKKKKSSRAQVLPLPIVPPSHQIANRSSSKRRSSDQQLTANK